MQKNEIQIKLNVEQDDINKKIYFINNIEELDDANNQYIKSSKITNFNACLELKNSNKKINSYNNYFLPEEQGEYIITLTFKEEIQNCNYMFYKCEYVTGLDFSNFCSKISILFSLSFLKFSSVCILFSKVFIFSIKYSPF